MSEQEPHSSRRSWWCLGLCGLGYLILFVAFYPPTHGIEDEVGFLNQSLVFSRGALSAEGAGYTTLPNFVEVGGRHVAWRNPGRALVTAPFWAAGGYAAVFASGALIHLLTVWVCALTLVRLGRAPLWAVLVLFHPTLLLFSRTVMADGLGGLGLAVAFYWLVAGKRAPGLAAGLALGAAALARYHIAVLVPFVALAVWRQPGRERAGREAVGLLVGAGIWGLLIASYNVTVLGGVLGSTAHGYFSAAFFGRNLLHYGVALLCLWPGMLLAPAFLDRRLRGVVLALIAPLFVFLTFYYWFDQRASWVETLVVGQRLLQPALPVWVVAYACVLSERAPLRLKEASPGVQRALVGVAAAGMLLGAGLLFHRHQGHLRQLQEVRAALVERVPSGSLVLASPSITKLFEVPREAEPPQLRFTYYHFQGAVRDRHAMIAAETQAVYLAHLDKPGRPTPPALEEYVRRYRGERLSTPGALILYRLERRG